MASNTSTKSEEENEQPKASEIIANNYDLSTKILLLTQPISISNLKVTSKLWHSILIDPTFTRNHTRHHPLVLSGLLVDYYWRSYYFPRQHEDYEYVPLKPRYDETGRHESKTASKFAILQYYRKIKVLDSCNGLVFCTAYEGVEYVCYVCNPTTLQRKRIIFRPGMQNGRYYGIILAFDPRVSSFYKLVCVKQVLGPKGTLHRDKRYQVDVYSSETDNWKTVGEPFFQLDKLNFEHGVFCKGAVHWLTNTWDCRYFDLNHECMKSTPKPQQAQQYFPFDDEYFGQSNDRLYLINRRHLPNYTLFQMMEDYSGWFVKYVVNLDVLSPRFPIIGRDFDISRQYETDVLYIGNMEGGNDIDENDVELVISLPGKILRFNPRTNASTEIGDSRHPTPNRTLYRNSTVHGYFVTICPV